MRARRWLLVLAPLLLALGFAWAAMVTGSVSVSVAPGPLRRARLPDPVAAVAVAEPDPACAPGMRDPTRRWAARVRSLGWPVRAGRVVDLLDGERVDVLVLPETPCLSRTEKRRVLEFVEAGGGLLAVGRVATRGPQREELDWSFLEEATGAERFSAAGDELPGYVSLRAGSPLAVGLAGSRLVPGSADRAAVAVALGRHAYWSAADLTPADGALPASYQVAALHARRGDGRVVWLGFEPLGTEPRVARLLHNAMQWVAGRPLAELRGWPHPHTSAATLIVNLAATPQNSGYAGTTLLEAGARGSFLVPAWFLDESGSLPPVVPLAGDISLGDLALERAPGTPGALLGLELERVRYRWAYGTWPSGASLRELSLEQAGLLARAGLDYAILSGESDSVRPVVVEVTRRWGDRARVRRLVQLTRMHDDDLNLSPLGLTGLRSEWIVRRILSDQEVVADLGGVYLLLVHTQGLSAPEHSEALAELLARWQEAPVWVASANDVAGWWLDRERLSVELRQPSTRELVVEIESAAQRPVRDVGVDLHVAASSDGAWRPAPEAGCRLAERAGDGPLTLWFPLLQPGERSRCDLHASP